MWITYENQYVNEYYSNACFSFSAVLKGHIKDNVHIIQSKAE